MSEPSKRTSKVVVVVFALVIFAGLSVNYVLRHTRPIDVERRGRVVAVDTATRKAQMTFIHPKNGEAFLISGEVPASCSIEHDGRQITLEDITPGTQVMARGQLFPTTKRIVATHVVVEQLPAPQVETTGAVTPIEAP